MPDPSATLDTAARRKARGAVFIPEPLARKVTERAVRDIAERILEPSSGKAAFLRSSDHRLAALSDASTELTSPHLDDLVQLLAERHLDSLKESSTGHLRALPT